MKHVTLRLTQYALLLLLTACVPDVTSFLSPAASVPTLIPSPLPRVTPSPANHFDFPLDPNHYGPYIHNVTGPLDVDTRYGVQNPGLGHAGKCFVDQNDQRVPFDQLYHAGEDWFAYDARRQVSRARRKISRCGRWRMAS